MYITCDSLQFTAYNVYPYLLYPLPVQLLHALLLHSCVPRSCPLVIKLSRLIPWRLWRRKGGVHLVRRQRVPVLTLAALCLLIHFYKCALLSVLWAPPALSAMLEDLRSFHCCFWLSSARQLHVTASFLGPLFICSICASFALVILPAGLREDYPWRTLCPWLTSFPAICCWILYFRHDRSQSSWKNDGKAYNSPKPARKSNLKAPTPIQNTGTVR